MRTVILFGAGDDGREVLRLLGSKRVYCFADNALCGTIVEGKRVISVEELRGESRRHDVLITSSRYGGEMEEQLQREGIESFFRIRHLKPFLSRRFEYYFNGKPETVSYDDYLEHYKVERYHSFCIYGLDGFTPYFVRMIRERAGKSAPVFLCRSKKDMVSDPDTDEPLFDSLDDVPDYECIFLNVPHALDDIREQFEGDRQIPAAVDLMLPDMAEPCFRHGELTRFRGLHRGKRCFLIGNGPSLRMEDLDLLTERGEITFGTNRIFHAFRVTSWRPNYYVCIDFRLADCIPEITNVLGGTAHCFCSDMNHISGEDRLPERENLSVLHLINQPYLPNLPSFSERIEDGVYEGYTVMYAAIQIAAYMGFEEICLLGVDHTHTSRGVTHFYGDEAFDEASIQMGQEEIDYSMLRATLAYRKAERYSRRHGFRIYNATRGGELEEFERIDFEQMFCSRL